MGVVYVGIVALCIKVFEKELAWATDKWLQVISNVYNSYTTREQRNKAILSVKQDDILISKNQALQIIYFKQDVCKTS